MKKLPEGIFALSIAHPGHELRLHGFLEAAKPFVFLLGNGGDDKKVNALHNYLGGIYHHTSAIGGNENARDVTYTMEQKGKSKTKFISDEEIILEIQQQDISFFELYTKKMANMFLFNKVEHVAMDAAEGFYAAHDICHVMTKLAARLAEKVSGKKITLYEFNTYFPVEHGMDENCIILELTPEQQEEKIKNIVQYHPSVWEELKQNLSIDVAIVKNYLQVPGGFKAIKEMLLTLNPDFFQYEALRPVQEKETYPADFEKHILPLKAKLEEELNLMEEKVS